MGNGDTKPVIHAFCFLDAWFNGQVKIHFGMYQNHDVEGPLANSRGTVLHAVPVHARPETITSAKTFTEQMTSVIENCCTKKVIYDDRKLLTICYTTDEKMAIQVIETAKIILAKMDITLKAYDSSDSYIFRSLKNLPSWVIKPSD